jgi:two-component system response regulator MprA
MLGARVLVVDDHDDGRAMVAHALRANGHHVTEASDGIEAMERLRAMLMVNHAPDVVITDVFMPNASGLTFASMLRAMGCRSRVIVITAHDGGDVRQRVGALDVEYLTKPLDLGSLCHMVTRLSQES